jgi:hypothetical protein
MSDNYETTPSSMQCGVYLLVEQSGRQLVGFVTMDEDGPTEDSRGYVKVSNPLQVMMQPRPDGVAVAFNPPVMIFLEEMYIRVSSWSECPKLLADKYAQAVLRHQEQEQSSGGLIQRASSISSEDLAAAAAVERMKVK